MMAYIEYSKNNNGDKISAAWNCWLLILLQLQCYVSKCNKYKTQLSKDIVYMQSHGIAWCNSRRVYKRRLLVHILKTFS